MNARASFNDEPPTEYHFDAIPEDDATQEELNRRLRKPGEPGYIPPCSRKPHQEQHPDTKDTDDR